MIEADKIKQNDNDGLSNKSKPIAKIVPMSSVDDSSREPSAQLQETTTLHASAGQIITNLQSPPIQAADENLKEQLKHFKRILNQNNTILNIITRGNLTSFDTNVLGCLLFIVSIVYITDVAILSSFLFSLFSTSLFFITIVIFILHCNYEIGCEALQSFLVWYKVIHACLGITARAIFENFYDTDDQKDKNEGWSQGWIYFRAIILIMNITLGVFAISVLDGFNSSINLRRIVLKIIVSFVGIFILTYQWLGLYVNRNNRDITNSIEITINDIKYNFYWQNIALSSYGKVLAFLIGQMYHNIRHYKRLNIVPQAAFVRYYSGYIDICPNHCHHNSRSGSSDNSPNTIQLQSSHKNSDKSRKANLGTLGENTTETDGLKNMDVDNHGEDLWQKARRRISMQLQLETRDVLSNHEVRDVLDKLDIDNTYSQKRSDELSHRQLNDEERKRINKGRYIILDMQIESTLLFKLLKNVFKFDIQKCLHISQLINKDKTEVFCVIIGFFFAILRLVFIHNIAFVVICDIIAFVSCLAIFCNLNYGLIHFKKTSLILYWKCYNIVTMCIAAYYLQYKYQTLFFKNENEFNASIADSVLIVVIVCFCTCFISLSQGMMCRKWIKIIAILFMIGFVSYHGLYHFLRPNYNYQVSFVLNQSFDLRAIIVSKSFDLVIFFTYQLVLIAKHPQRINLISKIPIEWTDDTSNQKSNSDNKNNVNVNIDKSQEERIELTRTTDDSKPTT